MPNAAIVITDEDRRMIRYFIEDKGDITRWTHWEEKKFAVFSLYPQLRAALFDLGTAERNLKHIVAGMENGELG